MAELDLFYSDEDRHRVVLLEQALVSAGVGVALHTKAFEPASDPVLGVLSEHAEDWMIAQAKRCSAQLIWLRLDHSEMPVAARQSLSLQNWPGRSADLAISELARSLRSNSESSNASSSKPTFSKPSPSRQTEPSATPTSAKRSDSRSATSRVERGPRPRVVLAWIAGVIVVFAGLLNLAPEPGEPRANDEELAFLESELQRAATYPATPIPAVTQADEPGVESRAVSGRLEAAVNAVGKTSGGSVVSELDVVATAIEMTREDAAGEQALITPPTPPTPPDASLCMALAATDVQAASEVLLVLSGWDRLLCRVAVEGASERSAVADSLARLCLAPTDAALAAWLVTLDGRDAPAHSCLPVAFRKSL